MSDQQARPGQDAGHGRGDEPPMPECGICREYAVAELTAERAGDLSRAVDCRVLLRRHQRADHRR
ncbi:hypothetical protein [Streptomyces sp. NPDC058953]|uniref:hypothetical protein n=1 Tax=unclassified Streptomyces TaxID=2593676 RepID=UPI0036AE52B3